MSLGPYTRSSDRGNLTQTLLTAQSVDRRQFLQTAALSTGLGAALVPLTSPLAAGEAMGDLHLATFRIDVSPPKGHSCCGGWIKPVVDYDDPLEAIGLVLLGAGKPVVICSVDWTGLLNSAHLAWRTTLAEAVGTTPDRVAVQCVHQHNAPFACLDAQRIVQAQGDLPNIVDPDFFQRCLERLHQAASAAVQKARPVTHVATGQAKVEKVASNRRILGPDGKLQYWRSSSTRNPLLHELPEGLIDPWLKTVAFYGGNDKLACCHYYATHPMSYYGDGRVSSDFVGLARKRRQEETPGCVQIYFTGCSGNVAAGKYNDGSPAARVRLTGRIYDAIVASENSLRREPVSKLAWKTLEVLPPPNEALDAKKLEAQIGNRQNPVVNRNRPSYMLAYIQRYERKQPIVLSALHIGPATLLHLPAESFIEYQLKAQQLAPERFVATAAYGDGGPWYVPTQDAYPLGGYEVSMAFCSPKIDGILSDGMKPIVAG